MQVRLAYTIAGASLSVPLDATASIVQSDIVLDN